MSHSERNWGISALDCPVCNLHCGQEATFWTEYEETEWFPIGKVVREGCTLSPYGLICAQNTSYEKLGWTQKKEIKLVE